MAKIALIDSGIDTEHFKANISGGISIEGNSKGEPIAGDDLTDSRGHGSACASAILKECPQSKIYVVKIFNNRLVSGYDSLKYALRHLSDVDVDIINLSLALDTDSQKYRDIIDITKELHKQGKEIFWAVKNGETVNQLFRDRSFWSIGIDDRIKDLYINEKSSHIRVNSLPYLHYKVNGWYGLFGASTSYATAKTAGIMANYIDTYKDKDIARSRFIRDHKKLVKFEPVLYKDESIDYDNELFHDLVEIIKAYFDIDDDDTVLEYSLFSKEISGHRDFCYGLIRITERIFGISFEPYTDLSKLDFVSIYSLYKITAERLKKKDGCNEKIS